MIPDLSNLRVVEVGTAVSIPAIGAILSNLGAEVIKIESRRKLDGNRVRLPKSKAPSTGEFNQDESFPLWHEFNPAKRSVVINIKSDVGLELFLRIIEQSDVFIQNFAPGWLERAGIDTDKLFEINPRLVMLFASGFGQNGPKSQQRVYAPVMTALGGLEALIGDESGEVFGGMPLAYGDFNATFFGLTQVAAALRRREETGRGCMIDFSQVEAVSATLGEAMVEYQSTGTEPSPKGNKSDYRVPHGLFRCRGDDQWASVSVGSDSEWRSFVEVVGKNAPDLLEGFDSTAWATFEGRVAASADVDAFVGSFCSRYERYALVELLQASGIRSAPVLEANEMEADAHMIDRDFTTDVPHPTLGAVKVTSTAWKFDGSTPRPKACGPRLGDSTREVLKSLCGLTDQQIDEYEKEGYLV